MKKSGLHGRGIRAVLLGGFCPLGGATTSHYGPNEYSKRQRRDSPFLKNSSHASGGSLDLLRTRGLVISGPSRIPAYQCGPARPTIAPRQSIAITSTPHAGTTLRAKAWQLRSRIDESFASIGCALHYGTAIFLTHIESEIIFASHA